MDNFLRKEKMSGSRLKIIRKELAAVMPALREKYGRKLKPFKSLYRLAKKRYVHSH